MLRRDGAEARAVLARLLDLGEGELDQFHPIATAFQTMVDPADPQTFARQLARGERAVSVLLLQGVADTMTIAASVDAVSVAMRAKPVAPVLLAPTGWRHTHTRAAPSVHGNQHAGRATVALVQLHTEGFEDHYVAFHVPRAGELVTAFLADVRAGRVPTVGPLEPASAATAVATSPAGGGPLGPASAGPTAP
jgi:hypothetical protein